MNKQNATEPDYIYNDVYYNKLDQCNAPQCRRHGRETACFLLHQGMSLENASKYADVLSGSHMGPCNSWLRGFRMAIIDVATALNEE